jgi:hypothetical protein
MKEQYSSALHLPKAQRIPEFLSEDEEREWWANHDTSDLPGEDVALARPPEDDRIARILAVPTDAATIARLKRLAKARGVDHHALARAWLHDRLAAEAISG